jgi:enoyl-[acyl-carrier protein] reductase III
MERRVTEGIVKDDWALVLGGSSGLGFACTKRLVSDGYRVFVVFREAREAARLAEERLSSLGPNVRSFNADATSEKGIQQSVQMLGAALNGDKVAVLLHSIACGSVRSLRTSQDAAQRDLALTPADLGLTVNAMGLSLYAWIHELQGRQWFAPDTRIIALTSEGARRTFAGYAAVSTAKAALEAVVRSIAVELGGTGLRANAIQAGVTDTASLRRLPNSDRLLANALARNPLGRLTLAQDVGDVVSLLCRPEAAFINGAVIPVDGGEHLC